MKVTKEKKIEIIKLLNAGMAYTKIAKLYNINKSTVNDLKRAYREHGDSALEVKNRHITYTADFKLQIVKRIKEGHGMRDVALKYNLRHSMIIQWVQKYDNFGYNGLKIDQRGRPKMKKNDNVSSKSVNNLTPKEKVKQLEKENELLKMENEYLKKLDALVQTRLKQQKKKK